MGSEETFRYPLSGISFRKPVRSPRAEDPVNPAFQDRRRHSPPVRMYDDQAICFCNFPAVPEYDRRERRTAGDLPCGKKRIEPLQAEVVEPDRMAGFFESSYYRCSDRVVKAPGPRVAEDHRDVQRYRLLRIPVSSWSRLL